MTEVQITDNWGCQEVDNIVNFFNENKKIRKLIKGKVFNLTNKEGTDVKFKITHIKYENKLKVNIKICGRMCTRWSYYGDVNKLTKGKSYGFRNVRARNERIRYELEDSIRQYFIMFGMDNYLVSVGNITICDKL